MKFDDLDKKMRVFETNADRTVLPGIFIVARIDGRSFTRLTKDICKFEAPFDVRFRDYMVSTTNLLMQCGFDVVYGYTQSDEISLLLRQSDNLFARKLRKINSVLAAEASANFSIAIGQPAAFDCRVSQLPSSEFVVDYFRWRAADALRNALNGYCYWSLRKGGLNAKQASRRLIGKSVSQKQELLFREFNVNFNDLPAWQKRGVGLSWKQVAKECTDRKAGIQKIAIRRRIEVDYELPMKEAYSNYISQLAN